MFKLPTEIQQYIYSFDRTYRDVFYNCLFDISEQLYVKSLFFYKRPGFQGSENAMIEEYRFLGIVRKMYTDQQCAEYITKNKRYKFLVDTYFHTEGPDFNSFYTWFGRNAKNLAMLRTL
jgi:hypothetical protein